MRPLGENSSHQPVNPPMDEDARENNEGHGEEQGAENNPSGAKGSEARPTEEQAQPKKENGTQPEEQGRAKKRFGWIRKYIGKYRVVVGVISAGVTIVVGLTRLTDMYISRRAYVAIGSGTGTQRVVTVLPGNEGIEIHLRNAGQTIIRRTIARVWILPEGFLASMKGSPIVEFPAEVTLPGGAFSVVVEWNEGPMVIPLIQTGEIGVGFVVRIDYQDAFFMWHCEEVSIEYSLSYPEGFIGTLGVPVCDTGIQSARYSRQCIVPFPDRVKGEWEGVWEWFPGNHRVGSPRQRNSVPCVRWHPYTTRDKK